MDYFNLLEETCVLKRVLYKKIKILGTEIGILVFGMVSLIEGV